MTDTIIGAFIGIGGAVIGATIAGPVNYFFSKILIKQSSRNMLESVRLIEFNKSVAAFRAAFAPALSFIYLAKKHGSTHDAPDVDKFLKDYLLSQAAAIEQFRPFVAESDRTAYQEAWEKYRYEVWNYEFVSNALNPEVDEFKVYEDMIHEILKFAKHK
jgi:hypothetical protein